MTPDTMLWQLIRASGLLAFALLSASVLLGLSIRTRALDEVVKRGWVNELHQSLSLAAFLVTVLHVALATANSHVDFGAREILVPFASGWRPEAIAAGTLAMYLTGLLVVSSYVRHLIGQRVWRAIHFGGFAAWALSLGHGVAAGTDSSLTLMQWFYLANAAAVGFLLLFRVLTAVAPGRATAGR